MQSVLSPIVGRLSDVLDRKYLASVPPLIAFVGAIISAKATSMSMLIGGGILIGTTLSTISIVQAIPSEILPLKYRALANGFAFMGGAIGGLSVYPAENYSVRIKLTCHTGLEVLVLELSPMSAVTAGATSSGSKQPSMERHRSVFSYSTGHRRMWTTPR